MHEERKMKEARFFLAEMHARERDPSAFIHMLSAFLSAARSVAQYAHKEATAKPGGQAWYDAEVAKHTLIGYFKDERDVNIHTKPVEPKAVWKTEGSISMFISGGADYGVKFVNEKGEPVEITFKAAPPPPPPPHLLRLQRWSGTHFQTDRTTISLRSAVTTSRNWIRSSKMVMPKAS